MVQLELVYLTLLVLVFEHLLPITATENNRTTRTIATCAHFLCQVLSEKEYYKKAAVNMSNV